MGLLKGNFSFCLFYVEDDLPQAFLNFINSRMRTNSFREAMNSMEQKRMGWVSLTDLLDTDFRNANYVLGDYLIFSLRVDRKMIAPSLLKIRIIEEERRWLAENGKEKINKPLHQEMKDRVKLELLAKTEPIPSFYDVCWAVSKKMLYFSSWAEHVTDDFIELFKKSFALNLKPFAPHRDIPISNHAGPDLKFSFIGREFLTWLWFKSEERNGKIKISDTEEVDICFLKRLVLEAGEGEYSQSVVCQGLHAELAEAREAIRQGKKIKEARMKLQHAKNEWEFTLKADAFHYQSLKIPEAAEWEEKDEDPAGKLLEQIYLIEKVVKVMNDLYGLFLKSVSARNGNPRKANSSRNGLNGPYD